MAESKYSLEGVYPSRVYCSRVEGTFYIVKPDIKPKDGLDRWLEVQVYQVNLDSRSSYQDTYQVYLEGTRRTDKESLIKAGQLHIGELWGTHTIIKKGVSPSWHEIEKYKSAFRGTGCLLYFALLLSPLFLWVFYCQLYWVV